MSQSGQRDIHEDPAEAEPSILSENQEERINARQEARRRQEVGDPEDKQEMEEETRSSQIQVDHSEKRMLTLLADGTQLVTNVMVASDSRESHSRTKVEEARRLRVEKLEQEAKLSMEKFEEINEKWMVAKMKQIPQDLRDNLISQQQLCGQLVQDKNNLITELQQELKQADDRYVKDLKRQAEDVDLLIERMEEQIHILRTSYREELNQIESAYDRERKVLLTGDRNKWEELMKQRSDKEMESLLQRMRRVEEYETLLQQLRVEDAEEYNMIKIKLDTDVQILEQQLQQMKATYQLNQEKLDYNYQVLKKRDEENSITKAQQKRRITRQQDVLNHLKVKCSNQEKHSKEENQNLIEDYQRIMKQYKHMQKKMRHFAAIDSKRFEDMWLMNDAEVKELVEKVLDMDRIIYQQQLGLAWERPSLPFMERCGPIRPHRAAQRNTLQTASEIMHSGKSSRSNLGTREASAGPGALVEAGAGALVEAGAGALVEASAGPGALVEAGPGALVEASAGPGALVEAGAGPGALVEAGPGALVEAGAGSGTSSSGLAVEGEREDSNVKVEKRGVKGEMSAVTVKKVLELLCDETGFLIESRLLKLLSPLDRDEQSLIKLDAIFTALGIESEEDINKMADFLIKYPQKQEEHAGEVSAADDEGKVQSCPSTPASNLIYASTPASNLIYASTPASNLIHPNDVLKALRAFTAQHQPGGPPSQQLSVALGWRNDSQDAAYWSSMGNILPENKLRIWTELETSMEKYHCVLTERSKLITETQSLKQQNTELRLLLQQYLTSKVNTELEIPPTKAMQLMPE